MKITKNLQSSTYNLLLEGLPASSIVASSLLFPAVYKHLQHNHQVQASASRLGLLPPSLLAASNLLFLATCWQLLDQPYYLDPAPASLLTASSLLFQPSAFPAPPSPQHISNFGVYTAIWTTFKYQYILRLKTF